MFFLLLKLRVFLLLNLVKSSFSFLFLILKNPVFITLFLTTFFVNVVTIYFLFQQQVYQNIQSYYQTELTKNKQAVQNQILFWENIPSPTSQVYLELAKLYSYLGYMEKAQELRLQALYLDPNSSN